MRDRRLGRIVAAALSWPCSPEELSRWSVAVGAAVDLGAVLVHRVGLPRVGGGLHPSHRHRGVARAHVDRRGLRAPGTPSAPTDFDVWHGGPAGAPTNSPSAGTLAPSRPAGAAAIPARYRDPNGCWTSVYVGVLGFCSNTDVLRRLGVPTPPLLGQPAATRRLAGQLSVPNARTLRDGYTLVWANRVRLGSRHATIDYLRRLKTSDVLQDTPHQGIAPALVAARGEAAVALTFSQHCVQARDAGYESRGHLPAEGAGAEDRLGRDPRRHPRRGRRRRYVTPAVLSRRSAWARNCRPARYCASDARLAPVRPRLVYTAAEAAAAKVALTDAVTAEVYQVSRWARLGWTILVVLPPRGARRPRRAPVRRGGVRGPQDILVSAGGVLARRRGYGVGAPPSRWRWGRGSPTRGACVFPGGGCCTP